ncbi:hypothetical protein BCAR13_1360012 [Paraburkholderia caribensis]|nr:hypothetical protein BCAR13_1360012 [Paraburkholderia caribensis]
MNYLAGRLLLAFIATLDMDGTCIAELRRCIELHPRDPHDEPDRVSSVFHFIDSHPQPTAYAHATRGRTRSGAATRRRSRSGPGFATHSGA